MTTATRTDAHRPSTIDPADYTELGAYYCGISDDMMTAYLPEHIALTDLGYGDDIFHSKCDHCGQNFAHGVLYRHEPTGDTVHVGHICAAETMSLSSRAALVRKRAESAAATSRERRMVWNSQSDAVREAHAYWKGDGDFARLADLVDATGGYGTFVSDLVHKTSKYPLSVAQEAALLKATAKAKEFDAKPKAEKAEKVALEDLPSGRMVVTGKCVAVKDYYNDFGGYTAASIIVEQDGREYLLWVKLTSTFDAYKGDEVTVKATLEPKDDGFVKGSRATQKGL